MALHALSPQSCCRARACPVAQRQMPVRMRRGARYVEIEVSGDRVMAVIAGSFQRRRETQWLGPKLCSRV